MADQVSKWKPGKYRAKTNMKIRGTPTWQKGSGNFINRMITGGKPFDVYQITENSEKTGEVWGVITLPNVSQTLYVCLYELNNVHADFVEPLDTMPGSESEEIVLLREILVAVREIRDAILEKAG